MKNKLIKFITHPILKSTILTAMPLIYGITYPISLTDGWAKRNIRLFDFSVCLTILDFIIAIIYIIYDIRSQKKNNDLTEQSTHAIAITKSSKELDNLIKNVSLDLYDRISNNVKHSYVKDWHYVQGKCDIVCKSLLDLVKSLSENGKDFSVSIFYKEKELSTGDNGFRMVARQSDHNSDNPKSYHNFISAQEAEGMYYKKVFDKNPTKADILSNIEEIKANFKDVDSQRFSQYVALPIKCKNNIVALLQIVAYNDSVIGKDRAAISKLCDDYFSIFANSILLIDKLENASQIINE